MSQRPPLQALVFYPAAKPDPLLTDLKFKCLASFAWGEPRWDPHFQIVLGVEQGWWDWECPSTVAVYQTVEELLKRYGEAGLARLLLRRVARELKLEEDAGYETILPRLERLTREDQRLRDRLTARLPAFIWPFADLYGILNEAAPPNAAPPTGTQQGEGEKRPAAKPDGPFDADGFRFAGVEVKFGKASKQYRLVMALWDEKKKSPAAPRPVEEVIAEVWGDDNETEDAAFRQLCADTRARFQKANCPLGIRQVNGNVQLLPV